MLTLNSPHVFTRDDFYHSGTQCCFSKKYNFQKNEIISDQNITSDDFIGFKNRNSFFLSNCGNLTITKCQFLSCYSEDSAGGGIRVKQYCEVILHNCIFNNCRSYQHGGAGVIATKIVVT